jgi:hypothetical protein
MSWERRWWEMVLAGGALAATACGGATTENAGAAADAASDDATAASGSTPCCNADPDPCCTCMEPPPPGHDACEQSWLQCEATHGTFKLYSEQASFTCTLPGPVEPSPFEAGANDGGNADADPTDATDDVQSQFPCCNANPDPCCPIAYCIGGVGREASTYITCEQNRTQCESMNGYYETQPDGSLSCTPTSTTGH